MIRCGHIEFVMKRWRQNCDERWTCRLRDACANFCQSFYLFAIILKTFFVIFLRFDQKQFFKIIYFSSYHLITPYHKYHNDLFLSQIQKKNLRLKSTKLSQFVKLSELSVSFNKNIFSSSRISSNQQRKVRKIFFFSSSALESRVVTERSNEIRLKLSECFQLHLSTAKTDSKQHKRFFLLALQYERKMKKKT